MGLSHALRQVQVAESLEGGVRFRAQDGGLIRAQRGLPGRALPAPRAATPQAPGSAGVGGAGLLRLLPQALPEVETRDLGVYEEVARAAGAD